MNTNYPHPYIRRTYYTQVYDSIGTVITAPSPGVIDRDYVLANPSAVTPGEAFHRRYVVGETCS